MKEGTSEILLQSGLNENWWADCMECYCYLRNIQDRLSNGNTPYEWRFGETFQGPIVQFWFTGISSHIHERPVKNPSSWEESHPLNLPPFCLKRERIWKGDILAVDLEELEGMDASEIHAKRLNAQEVTLHKVVNIANSLLQMEQYNLMEEIRH